jgi:hypothetical protein
MDFSVADKVQMLALKGVGNTVIMHLEQLDFSKLEHFVGLIDADVTKNVSEMLDVTIRTPERQSRR